MRIRVVSTEVVPPDCVQVTITPYRGQAVSVIVLPFWVCEHLKLMAGDVLSICREDRGFGDGALQGFRVVSVKDAN